MRPLVAGLALAGCAIPTDGPPSTDCVDVALRDALGHPDGCDLAACTTCGDACADDCAILESYPPQYACDGMGSWSVYDLCPDWLPPAAGPSATNVEDLGCGDPGAEAITATATGPGKLAVTHTDYLGGCCPESVAVEVVAVSTVLAIDYALVNDPCECYCELDVAYDIVDVPSGTWTIVAGRSGATTAVTVP